MMHINNNILFDDGELEERFVRAFGARGVNPEKEATAVELRLNLNTSSLPADMKARLAALAGRKVNKHGELVVVSRVYRSQAENRDAAHARLVSLLQRAAVEPLERRASGPDRAAREARLASKHSQAERKLLRRPLRPAGG